MAKQWWGVLVVLSATVAVAKPVGVWINDANDVMSSRESLRKAFAFAHERGIRKVYLPVYRVGQMYFDYPRGVGGTDSNGAFRLPNAMNEADEFRKSAFTEAQKLAKEFGPEMDVVPWFQGGVKTLYHPPGSAGSPPAGMTMKNASGSDFASEPADGQFSYLNVLKDPKVGDGYIDMIVNFMKQTKTKTIQLDDHFTVQNAFTQGQDYTEFAFRLAKAIHDRVGPDAGYELSINPAFFTQQKYSLNVPKLLKRLSTELGYKRALKIQVFRHEPQRDKNGRLVDGFRNTLKNDVIPLRDELKPYGIPVEVAILAEPGTNKNSRESLALLNDQLDALNEAHLPLGGIFSFQDYIGSQGAEKQSFRGLLRAVNQGESLPHLAYTDTSEIVSFSPAARKFNGDSTPSHTRAEIASAVLPATQYTQAGHTAVNRAPIAHIAMEPQDKEPKLPRSPETPVHTEPMKQSYAQLEQKANKVFQAPVDPPLAHAAAAVSPTVVAPKEVPAAKPVEAAKVVPAAQPTAVTPTPEVSATPQVSGRAPLPGHPAAQNLPAPTSARSSSAPEPVKVGHSQPRTLSEENARRALAQEKAHAAAEAKAQQNAKREACDSGKPIMDCLRTLEAGTYNGTNDKGENCTLIVSYEKDWMFRRHSQPLVHFLLYNNRDRVTQQVLSGTKKLVKRDAFKNNEFAEFTIGQDAPASAPVPGSLPKTGTISKVWDSFRPQADGSTGVPMPRPSVEGALAGQGQFALEIEEDYYRFKAVTPRWVENDKLVRNVTGKEEVQLDKKNINVAGRIANSRVDSLVIATQDSPNETPKNLDCHGLRLARDGAPAPGASPASSTHH